MTAQRDASYPTERGQLWTVTDVAKFLNVSEAYIYELAKRGLIPRGKLGRVYRFEKAEVERWWSLRKNR